MSGNSLAISIDDVRSDRRATREDRVAVEEPLEIQVCSADSAGAAARSLSITMRTPGNDVELALGFLLGESIIRSVDDIVEAAHVGSADPDSGFRNVVRIELQSMANIDSAHLERHFYTTSSCGVCGKSSLDALRTAKPPERSRHFEITRAAIVDLPGKLFPRQAGFQSTGGLHAAAAFDREGEILISREDVGRHNAVDKVVGALLQEGRLPADDLGLFVSGRASFELMQKTLMAGMPMLAAVSAPSSLAVKLAEEFGLTLVGFLRDARFNIYSGATRIED